MRGLGPGLTFLCPSRRLGTFDFRNAIKERIEQKIKESILMSVKFGMSRHQERCIKKSCMVSWKQFRDHIKSSGYAGPLTECRSETHRRSKFNPFVIMLWSEAALSVPMSTIAGTLTCLNSRSFVGRGCEIRPFALCAKKRTLCSQGCTHTQTHTHTHIHTHTHTHTHTHRHTHRHTQRHTHTHIPTTLYFLLKVGILGISYTNLLQSGLI